MLSAAAGPTYIVKKVCVMRICDATQARWPKPEGPRILKM